MVICACVLVEHYMVLPLQLEFVFDISHRLGLDLSCVVHWRMQQLMMCMFGCCQIIELISYYMLLFLVLLNFHTFMINSTPKLYCDKEEFPYELLHPLEDCNVNSSLSFTLQVLCKVLVVWYLWLY